MRSLRLIHYLNKAVLLIFAAVSLMANPSHGKIKRGLASIDDQKFTVHLKRDQGSVEFFATGWPSALQIHGKGPSPEGSLTVNGNSVTATIEFDLNSLDTGIRLRDKHMKETYLETGKFPSAKLWLTRLDLPATFETKKTSSIEGVPFEAKLTLHGVERIVNGTAAIDRKGDQIAVTAQFELKTGDYQIEIPSFAGITMAEEVKVTVQFSSTCEFL